MSLAVKSQYAIQWVTLVIGIGIGSVIGGFATIMTQRIWGLLW